MRLQAMTAGSLGFGYIIARIIVSTPAEASCEGHLPLAGISIQDLLTAENSMSSLER